MRYNVAVLAGVTLAVAVGIALAQDAVTPPAAQGKTKGRGRGAPKNPSQSPASQPGPKTVTPQTYPADQIRAGEQRFTAQCGFCHGRDATGGEGGPDLTRSELVAQDNRGDKIAPLIRSGRGAMPAITDLSDADVNSIVAFVHDQKTTSESLGGGRRSVNPDDLATGNASAGRRYFNGAGGCAACHSATGDLKDIGARYQGLALIQRMLYPTAGRPAPPRPKVTVALASGEVVTGPLAGEDEWTVSVGEQNERKTYNKTEVKYNIDDPMSKHFDLLAKYTDADMHDVYAYLSTLK